MRGNTKIEYGAPALWHRALRQEEWLVANGLCLDPVHVEAAIRAGWKYPDGLLESRETLSDLTLEILMEAFAGQGMSTLRVVFHLSLCNILKKHVYFRSAQSLP